MTNRREQCESEFLPEIRIGKIDFLQVHQVSDEELTKFAEGSPQSLYFNFAIALLATATSFLISLFTTMISSDRVFAVFVVVTVVGYLAGLVLLMLWWRTRKRISELVATIRKRMPPEGEAKSPT